MKYWQRLLLLMFLFGFSACAKEQQTYYDQLAGDLQQKLGISENMQITQVQFDNKYKITRIDVVDLEKMRIYDISLADSVYTIETASHISAQEVAQLPCRDTFKQFVLSPQDSIDSVLASGQANPGLAVYLPLGSGADSTCKVIWGVMAENGYFQVDAVSGVVKDGFTTP